jgi:hypothetical protein
MEVSAQAHITPGLGSCHNHNALGRKLGMLTWSGMSPNQEVAVRVLGHEKTMQSCSAGRCTLALTSSSIFTILYLQETRPLELDSAIRLIKSLAFAKCFTIENKLAAGLSEARLSPRRPFLEHKVLKNLTLMFFAVLIAASIAICSIRKQTYYNRNASTIFQELIG